MEIQVQNISVKRKHLTRVCVFNSIKSISYMEYNAEKNVLVNTITEEKVSL